MALDRRTLLKGLVGAGAACAGGQATSVHAAARVVPAPDAVGMLYDSTLCIGCKACVAACPYGARYVHPKGYVDKCTFCLHRVKEGKQPACVSVCPMSCMHFGDLDDPKSVVATLLRARKWHTLLPEAGTRPRVFYLE